MQLKNLIMKLIPLSWRKIIKNFWILSEIYGQRYSIIHNKCVDKDGNEIPWYTFPAYEYLKSLDFKNSNVLEFGSGASSSWWAKRARTVTAIEHDKHWFDLVKQRQTENLEILFASSEYDYLTIIPDRKFDLIIIDGMYRYKCAKVIKNNMNKGALVILDNSDWYPDTARFLREEYDLLQVDMHGFGPINNYTWTTSIFFSRDFNCKPANNRLPEYSAGAITKLAED